MTYKLFTDGGSRGNPGPAGAGAFITDADDSVVAELAEYLGATTNNVAEYRALILGLKKLIALKAE
ncbi:MAG: RNase H family protein, partial [bacterium]|nr:RNase H family protein [bacterium]